MFPTLTYTYLTYTPAAVWQFEELEVKYPGHWSETKARDQLVAYLNESYPEFKFVFRHNQFNGYHLMVADVKTPNKEYSVYDIYQKHPFSGYGGLRTVLLTYFINLRVGKLLVKAKAKANKRYSSVSIQGNKLVLS